MKGNKRVLLTTIGSFGDLHPMIALAIELKRRGHEITIATTEVYRQKIEQIGIRFHPIRPNHSLDTPEFLRILWDLKAGPEFIIRKLFMPYVQEMYDDLIGVAGENDFMLVSDLAFAAPIVSEKINLPWAYVALAPTAFFSVYDPSVIAPLSFTKYMHNAPTFLHQLIKKLGESSTLSWCRPAAELRKKLGLPQKANPLFKGKYSPYLNLVLFSSVLGSPQPDWPLKSLQTGFVFYDKDQHDKNASKELKDFLTKGEPPIVFTLGSAAVLSAGPFYEESIKAALKLGRRALLLIGPNVLKEELPESVAAFDYAPFSEVFPQSACVVHQGGVGTTAQVLRAGVPQLVVPFGFDQPDNAARVVRLGVAHTIDRKKYKAESVAKLLGDLLDNPKYKQKALEVSRKLQAEDGLRVACDAIEKQML